MKHSVLVVFLIAVIAGAVGCGSGDGGGKIEPLSGQGKPADKTPATTTGS